MTFVPLRIEKFVFYARPNPLDLAAGRLWSHATLHTVGESEKEVLQGEIRLFSAPDQPAAGQLIAKATGFTVKKVSREALLQMPADWAESSESSESSDRLDAPLGEDDIERFVKKAASAQPVAFLQQLKAVPASEHQALLEAEVRAIMGQVLGLNRALDDSLGFFELGMDSLSSLELRNRLQNRLGCVLHITFAFDYPNLKSLVAYLASQLLSRADDASESLPAEQASLGEQKDRDGAEKVEPSSAFGNLQELSQEQLAALLATELALID